MAQVVWLPLTWLWADAVASLFVASFLICSAVSLWRDSFKALMEDIRTFADVTAHFTDHSV